MSKHTEVLQMIVDDMESDVKEFEGAPFTSATLGKLHGNLCASVQAVAKILKQHIEDTEKKETPVDKPEVTGGHSCKDPENCKLNTEKNPFWCMTLHDDSHLTDTTMDGDQP